ncbi:MAG: molybdopterin cofactor-binding domain-containing protein [Enterocloster bolteae]
MGLGYAVYEHNVTREGKILNPNFRDYRLPTALDMPKMRNSSTTLHRTRKDLWAQRKQARAPAAPVAPAIANAVNMATGVYFTRAASGPGAYLESAARHEG